MITLDQFNQLPADRAREELLRCCGSAEWAEHMIERRPFREFSALLKAADVIWSSLDEKDWREAFDHHPRIGDVSRLREKFGSTAGWASEEQKGASEASEAVLQALADGNRRYEERFGHIFLVCATGKTAPEMLAILESRMSNAPERELRVAAGEQAKITRIRLEKLIKP